MDMDLDIATRNHCRLCGKEKEHMTYICDKKILVHNIRYYLQILIYEDDTLPLEICDACENTIEKFIQFVTECQNVQRKLPKLSMNNKMKISMDAIKVEESEMKIDSDPSIFDVHADISNPGNKIQFTLRIPELSTGGNGELNTSIWVATNPDSNELQELLGMGRHNLKQLGKAIYKKYQLQVQEKNDLQLTFSDIEEDFIHFRNSLEREDPLSGASDIDNKDERAGLPLTVPPVVMQPLNITSNADSDPLGHPVETANGFTKESENLPQFLTCIHCPFETDQRFRLNRHYEEIHEKPFKCNRCDRRFGKKTQLASHEKAEHTDIPPITCSVCSISFTQKYDHTEHMKKTHSNNDKLWYCTYCKQDFSHQHKLDVHTARYHQPKNVKCSKCAYVAAHKYQLKQHMREVHLKPIECHECGKRESKKCRMEAHIRSKHMAKKMYECEVCTTKYTSKKWFESHLKKGCPGALPFPNPAVMSSRQVP